jgi:hypothetical protein
MDWGHNSSGRAFAYQVQGPEFNPEYCNNNNKNPSNYQNHKQKKVLLQIPQIYRDNKEILSTNGSQWQCPEVWTVVWVWNSKGMGKLSVSPTDAVWL